MNEIAILLAAGKGTRLRPLTDNIPKPMVKVYGIPMVETVLQGLKKRGVNEIIIVTGYLGEKIKTLKNKYNLTVIENTEYETVNNISSIHAALPYMGKANCFICEADLYVSDTAVFQGEFKESCYFGKWVDGYSDDWVFDQDDKGRIIRVGKVGINKYNMCGISYFLKEDAKRIGYAVAEAYEKGGYEELFWDEIVNRELKNIYMIVHPVGDNQIFEIDTVKELSDIDPTYDKYVDELVKSGDI